MFTNSPSTLTFCPLQKRLLLIEKYVHGKVSTHWDVLLCQEQTTVTQHQCRWRQMCGKCLQIHQEHSLFVRSCPHWTIYSWQSFNSLGCRLMLRTNYRCVQLLNIIVDVTKCVENVHKFTKYIHFLAVAKYCLCWLNNLFMTRFQLNRMSSYAKNKLQMCSVTQHQCRRRQMCGKCSQIHPVHSLFVRYKNDFSWLKNMFMARFQLIGMSCYAKNKLQSLNISVDDAKCVGNVHKFTQYTQFFFVTEDYLCWLNNLFVARFQLISMFSYANNKQ